jgi:tetratricopeptide (TPR) repeat protein
LTTFDAQNTCPCFESSFEIKSTSANTSPEPMVSTSVSATETIVRPCRQSTTEVDAQHSAPTLNQLDNSPSPHVEISIPDRIEVHRLSAKLEEVIRQAGGQVCFDDFKMAFELCEKVEQGLWNKLEQTTIDQLLSLRRAALAHLKADDFRLAIFEFRTLLELSKRFLGPNHSLIAGALGSLAVLFQSREDFGGAEVYYLQLVQHHEESSQGESFHMLFAVRGLAHVYLQQAHEPLKARWAEAISEQERAVSLSRKLYGPADDVTEECLWDLLQ